MSTIKISKKNLFMLADTSSAPYRVVTIGDESVGKTSLTSRLVDKTFNQYEPSTVGANYQTHTVSANGEFIVLQIWDTAGQEKFKSLSPIYFRNALAAVVVFSLVNRTSFEKLTDWIKSFKEVAGEQSIVYIAANKTDLVDQYQVQIEEAKEWAENHNYKFFATSAKTGENVNEMFTALAIDLQKSQTVLQVQVKPQIKEKTKSGGCCG